MRTSTIAIGLAALIGTACSGQITLIDLLPGYTLGGLHGISADGSTLAVDMMNYDLVAHDAYGMRDGAWFSLPRYNRFNNWQGISSDGRTTLSLSSRWGLDPYLVRVENGERQTIISGAADRSVSGGLTRDGQTVFYSMHHDTGGPVGLYRHRASGAFSESLGTLSDRFVGASVALAGSRDDFFILSARLDFNDLGVGGTRTMVYDAGNLIEMPTLTAADIIHSNATAMTPDGSVIVGVESSRNLGDQIGMDRSWILQDGVFSELTIAGFTGLQIHSMTDDARAMTGYATDADGVIGTHLFYADGRSYSAAGLLAANGVTLAAGEHATIAGISADGTTVYGGINHGTWSAFGLEWTLFTVRVPTPGGVCLLTGLCVLAARRKRQVEYDLA